MARRTPKALPFLVLRAAVVALVAVLASSVSGVTGADGDITGIDVSLPTGNRISGTITDGGDPIEGLSVEACSVSDECFGEALTAADGTYAIRGLVPDTYLVLVSPIDDSSDYLRSWYTPGGPVADIGDATVIDATSGDVAGIDLAPLTGHRISGTVTGPSDIPLDGVWVSARGSSGGGSATTDPSGAYTMHGLPDGTYSLDIRVPVSMNFRSGSVVGGGVVQESGVGDPVVVSGADVTGVDVQAAAGLKITGTLTGSEANGAGVEAFDDVAGVTSDQAIVGSNGAWQIAGLWPGSYQIGFQQAESNPGFDSLFPLGYWRSTGTLTTDPAAASTIVLSSSNRTGVNATIPAGLTLSGTVTGADGALAEPAYVYVCATAGCSSTLTGAGDSWSLRHVVAGDYVVQAFQSTHIGGYFGPGGFAVNGALATKVTITTSSKSGVNVVLPVGLGIAGLVTGPSAEAVEGANINASAGGGSTPANSGSDDSAADGSYRLPGLDAGLYKVSVNPPDGTDYLRGYYDADDPAGYTADYDQATQIDIAAQGVGTSYVPISPTRVLDSRVLLGAGKFSANTPQAFPVAGFDPIPAEAVAVTGNVTVVGQTAGGYVAVTPTPTATPKVSTINFPLGDIRANNFTVPVAEDGTIAAVFKAATGAKTHLVVDISGYFMPGDGAATYFPLAPVRVLDSRPTASIGLAGPFVANTPRSLVLAGTNGIPSDAVAITGNLTVVGQSKGWIPRRDPRSNRGSPVVDAQLPGR